MNENQRKYYLANRAKIYTNFQPLWAYDNERKGAKLCGTHPQNI